MNEGLEHFELHKFKYVYTNMHVLLIKNSSMRNMAQKYDERSTYCVSVSTFLEVTTPVAENPKQPDCCMNVRDIVNGTFADEDEPKLKAPVPLSSTSLHKNRY